MTLARPGFGFAVCALLAAAACTPDFQSASQVTDLRVLAIRQDALDDQNNPTFADASVDLAAKTAQKVRVTALVVDATPRELAARARLCQPTDSGRCDGVPAADLPGSPPPPPGSPPPPPATDHRPVFEFQAPPEVVALALQSDDLKGLGGIRVQFSLDASDGDPHGPVLASKILLYTSGPDSMRNHNPEVVRLEILRDGAQVPTANPGAPIPLTAGVEYGVRPVLGDGTAGIEEYDAVDLTGKPIHLRETPRYSFFGTVSLDIDRNEADEPLLGQPEPPNGLARFTPAAGPGSMWVVARDGRGGTGWISVGFVAASP